MPFQLKNYKSPGLTAPRLTATVASEGRNSVEVRLARVAQMQSQAEQARQAAIGHLQRAVALAPELPALYHSLADLYRVTGLAPRAQQMLDQAEALEARQGAAALPAAAPPAPGSVAAGNSPGADAGHGPAPVELSAGQRRALNAAAQQVLVRIIRLASSAGEGEPGLREIRDGLKVALASSQQVAWAERPEEVQLPTAPAPVVAPQPAGQSVPLVHDLGPVGQRGVVSLGPEVASLQQALQRLGLSVRVSGRYDSDTVQAIKTLHRRYHLATRGGVVDAATRRLLLELGSRPAEMPGQ